MMRPDIFVIGCAAAAFMTFVLVQLVCLRRIKPEELLKALVVMFSIVLAGQAVCIAAAWFVGIMFLSASGWICVGALSVLLYGLLSFNYVLCLFGPYETSVRMRLVREISRDKKGISREDLFKNYNEHTIVDIRLKRLLGSGDMVKSGGLYTCNPRKNVFFIMSQAGQILKKWIG